MNRPEMPPEARLAAVGGDPLVRRAVVPFFGPDTGNEAKPVRFAFEMAGDIPHDFDEQWLVDGLLPADGLCAIYGAPSAGKSFLALDLALHVSLGRTWFGRQVTPGPVVYVAAEAGRGLRKRVRAFMLEYCSAGERPPLAIVHVAPNLGRDPGDARQLIADIWAQVSLLGAKPVAVFLDTLSRVLFGAEENSAEAMGVFIANAARIGAEFGCPVLPVHHSGKNAELGMHGSSSLHGACDCEWKVEEASGLRTVTVVKQKDGEDGISWCFRLAVLEVGNTSRGRPITSCVVRAETPPHPTRPVSRKKEVRGMKAALLGAVKQALDEMPSIPPGSNQIPPGMAVTTREAVRLYAMKRAIGNPENPKSQRSQINSLMAGLSGDGQIRIWDEYVWLLA